MTGVLIALAGGLGAVLRFLVDGLIARRGPRVGVPLGTAVINCCGSLALGFVASWGAAHGINPAWVQPISIGLLGGFTTFSAASVEAARLVRSGPSWRLVLHSGGMLVLSLAAAAAGIWLGGL